MHSGERETSVERKWANVEGKRERNKVNKAVKEKWRKEWKTLDGGKIEKQEREKDRGSEKEKERIGGERQTKSAIYIYIHTYKERIKE